MSTPFKVVIPARLNSTRLPRKVLRQIHGRPLIAYVWDAARASGADSVIIAADDPEVADAARAFGADVRLTATTHQSGTDRVHEVARSLGWPRESIVVNLQGDEPLMPPALIRAAAQLLAEDASADIASLCHPIHAADEWRNPNVVKVTLDRRGFALYFSRAPMPWQRDGLGGDESFSHFPAGLAYRHVGLYAYRVGSLVDFASLPPAPLERCEALEQLRALHHGLRIKLAVIEQAPPRGVDTEADLETVSAALGRS